MELVQIYFKKLDKVAVISNFLASFQFLVDKFTLLDPDPHNECVSGSRRENECGSMRIRIHSPVVNVFRAYFRQFGVSFKKFQYYVLLTRSRLRKEKFQEPEPPQNRPAPKPC